MARPAKKEGPSGPLSSTMFFDSAQQKLNTIIELIELGFDAHEQKSSYHHGKTVIAHIHKELIHDNPSLHFLHAQIN